MVLPSGIAGTGAMTFRTFILCSLPAMLLGACASVDVPGPGAVVHATLETPSVGTANADAADDPAIWASPRPVTIAGVRTPGFVAGTDKKAGLYVYGFDGAVLQFLPAGLLNNVDVVDGLGVNGRPQVLLGASDRTPGRMGASLYLFDPAATAADNAVRPWGLIPSDLEEPYGFCFGRRDGQVHAVLIGKDGQVRQLVISADAAGAPVGREVRRFAVGSISEGCAIDEAGDALYIGQEPVGVWRYGLEPASGDARIQIGAVDGDRLTADVEGVTVLEDGGKRYLIVSSQGDYAFAVWRIDGSAPAYAGRFAVHAGERTDAVTGTDGVDALGGSVGPFPEGVVVVQDDVNDGAQNFKYIDWRDIRAALGL